MNIVITDDHKLFRRGIRALLEDFDFIDEINEAENGKDLLDLLPTLSEIPDLILLDLRMPVMDGIDTTQKLKEQYPDIKIIILTMEDDEQMILHMIGEGVNGYLMKSADPEELEQAILKVMEKDFYFSNDISTLVLRNLANGKRKQNVEIIDLTKREKEILRLICEGYTAPEIAEKLFMSIRTVEGYRRKMLEKTCTRNIAGLVVFAIKNNLVTI